MRLRALSCALLALLLLAGCNAPAAQTASPAPPPSEAPSAAPLPSPDTGPQVVTHWDALTEKEKPVSTARRLSEGPLDDFTPGNYGGMTFYLGGESRARQSEGEDGEIYYETYYRYGLCAADGTILTDPVFDSVYRLSFYDQEWDVSQALPVWVVTRSLRGEEGADEWSRGYYTAVGLVAADGSWYTGCRFRAGVSSTIAVGRDSVLLMEDQDNAVLISLADGSELARYSPYDFIGPDDPNGVAEWLFADGLNWGMLRCYGDYFYCDPAMSGGAFEGEPIWIDGATGAFLDEAPMEIPEDTYLGRYTFDGGWYLPDGNGVEFTQGGDLTLHYDDGREEIIHLTGELGQLTGVSADNLTFFRYDEDNQRYYGILTDHALNVLFSGQETGGGVELYGDAVTGRYYPCYNQLVDEDAYTLRYVLLNARGERLAAGDSCPRLNDGFASFVDGAFYRLVEFSGESCREVFRLPRWEALDMEIDE